MSSRVKTFAAWLIIATIFAALGGLSAHAQDASERVNRGTILAARDPIAINTSALPTMVDGAWVLPVRGSGNAPSGGGNSSSYQSEIEAACAYWGCDPGYVYSVMMCESGGDHGALAYNPQSGNYTYGIMQIDGMWGGGGMSATEQIWFAAEHLTKGDIWWACG